MTTVISHPLATPRPASPTPSAARRFRIYASLALGSIALLLLVMLGRVAQLQLSPSSALREQMVARVTVRKDDSQRGDITDRRGRLLSATRFGYRVIVDPTQLKAPYDENFVKLAAAMNADASDVGSRIMSRIVENDRRAQLRTAADAAQRSIQGPAGLFRSLSRTLSDALAPQPPAPPTDPNLPSAPTPPVDVDPRDLPPQPPPKSLATIRYVPMSGVLTDAQVTAVRSLKVRGIHLERVSVREYPGGDDVASIVGFVGFGHKGLLGAEKDLDRELTGTPGTISYVRDAKGRPLWVEPGQIAPAAPGHDVRLSLDLELQRIAIEELRRGVEDAEAAGGRLVMVDPLTGEILAMVDLLRDVPDAVPYPWAKARNPKDRTPDRSTPPPPARYVTIHRDPAREQHAAERRNRCVEDIYEPGSTFKPFVWSTITESGKARLAEVFDTEGGRWHTSYGRYIEDVTKRATMTWGEVLINSSNIGMVKAAERLSFKQLRDAAVRFGFGSRTNIGLPGETGGIVTAAKDWSKYSQTSVAYGHEIAVTPVQMVRAFSAFARPGDLAGTLPPLRLTAATADDLRSSVIRRVLKPETATLTRDVLRSVAANVETKMLQLHKDDGAQWKYTLFGKSGTAEIPLGKPPSKDLRRPRGVSGYYDNQYNSSFIAGGPAEDPRLICLVVIDDPGPSLVRRRLHYGASVAGPVVRRVMERALTYLGVAPSPVIAETQQAAAVAR